MIMSKYQGLRNFGGQPLGLDLDPGRVSRGSLEFGEEVAGGARGGRDPAGSGRGEDGEARRWICGAAAQLGRGGAGGGGHSGRQRGQGRR